MSSDLKRYRDNLRDELNGAALYAALADAEVDPIGKDLFLQLSQAESAHAQLWRAKLATAGINDEHFVPGFRTRLLAHLAKRFGPGFVLPTIAAAEAIRSLRGCTAQPRREFPPHPVRRSPPG